MDLKTGVLMPSLFIGISMAAQYGTFNSKQVAEAKERTTLVVLDDGDSQYNRVIMDAVKGHWNFGEYDFVRRGDLATSGYLPDNNYLLKQEIIEEKTHTGTLLTLVSGWKMKKGQMMETGDHGMKGIPGEQMLAYTRMDEQALQQNGTMAMLMVYIKQLQDYLGQVSSGKITDKSTADRLYSGRTRHIRDGKLIFAADHMVKDVSEPALAAEFYSNELELGTHSTISEAVQEQNSSTYVGDVVLTGEYKTKYCFKRIFNAGTGELVFQSETPALYGKKEGFLDEDLKDLERAR